MKKRARPFSFFVLPNSFASGNHGEKENASSKGPQSLRLRIGFTHVND